MVRFLWTTGSVGKENHLIPWNLQVVNAAPAVILWRKNTTTIEVKVPGLYRYITTTVVITVFILLFLLSIITIILLLSPYYYDIITVTFLLLLRITVAVFTCVPAVIQVCLNDEPLFSYQPDNGAANAASHNRTLTEKLGSTTAKPVVPNSNG